MLAAAEKKQWKIARRNVVHTINSTDVVGIYNVNVSNKNQSVITYYNKLTEKSVYTVHCNKLCANIVYCLASCDHHEHTTRHQTHSIYTCILYATYVVYICEASAKHRIAYRRRHARRSRARLRAYFHLVEWVVGRI